MRGVGLLYPCRNLVLLLGLVCFLAWGGFAQDILTKGNIEGIVVDPSDAVIRGAKVTVSGDIDKLTVTSDQGGRFEAANLRPGSYSVNVEANGFKTLTIGKVVVNVGKTTGLRAKMEVGRISESITVVAGMETMDLSSTATSSNLNENIIENLPLERSVTSLFYLAPGASDAQIIEG